MSRKATLLSFVALVATAAWAVSDNVELLRMLTENHVVSLYLVGESDNGHPSYYTLTCNEDQPTCRVPEKGWYYHMESSERTVYQCPEVTLSRITGKREVVGVYCLNDMY